MTSIDTASPVVGRLSCSLRHKAAVAALCSGIQDIGASERGKMVRAQERAGTLNTAGLNLPSGEVYKIAGTQVVGARQTGTPADATDLASAMTLVNALKAKLITHGLIG